MAAMATAMVAPRPPRPSKLASSGVVVVDNPVVRLKPIEEIYRIRVERGAGEARLRQLGVERWSNWEAGDCGYVWNWKVDEWVYIEQGTLFVHPIRSELCGEYNAGDLVRFPKWFDAYLHFEGSPYRQRYRFVAYGDTELD